MSNILTADDILLGRNRATDIEFQIGGLSPSTMYDIRTENSKVTGIVNRQAAPMWIEGRANRFSILQDIKLPPPHISYSNFTITGIPQDPPPIGGGVRFLKCKPEFDFKYGNCAKLAICQAFEIKDKAMSAICIALKMPWETYNTTTTVLDECGMTFFEIKKLINHLCKAYGWENEYQKNYHKVNYVQLLSVHNKGKILSMFDIHLSFAEDGTAYDTYYYNYPLSKMEEKIPTGWWKLTENK